MDENEITTVADTQAENTADTADTGQTTPTTEELIQQLTARVAALEEIVGEEEYELRYKDSGADSKSCDQALPTVYAVGVCHGEYEGQR